MKPGHWRRVPLYWLFAGCFSLWRMIDSLSVKLRFASVLDWRLKQTARLVLKSTRTWSVLDQSETLGITAEWNSEVPGKSSLIIFQERSPGNS